MNTVQKHILFSILLVVLTWATSQAQKAVSFTAQANAKEILLNDNFQIFFKINHSHAKDFQAPPFKHFQSISGQNVSSSFSNVNGNISVERTFSYHLKPKKIGTFTIGKASIMIDGKKYETKPISIKVVKGNTAKRGAANTQKKIYVKASVAQDTVYPGQQVTLEYKIYTQTYIQQYHIVGEPSYDGFHTARIRRFNSSAMKEVINGVSYTTQVLRKVALYPHQTGKITIDPIRLRLLVPAESSSRRNNSPFSFMQPTESFFIQSNALDIQVNPLPSPAPESFSGGVGKYTAKATLDKTVATTDDALTLRLSIEGKGDIKRLVAPKLILSDTFEVYDPNVIQENQTEQNGTLYGYKTFEYLILPKYAGSYAIAPEFSYFDSELARYNMVYPDTFHVDISKGIYNTNVNKKPVEKEKVKQEIRPVFTTLDAQQPSRFVGSTIFWSLVAFPILVLIGGVLYRRYLDNKPEIDPIAEKRKKAHKVAKQRLSQAEKHLKSGDSRSFYDEVSKGLLGYASSKFNISGSELKKSNVEQHLRSSGAKEEHITRFMDLIKTCERAVYAPGSVSGTEVTYKDALTVIMDIEG